MRKRIVIFVLGGLCLTIMSILGARFWILGDEVQPPRPARDAAPIQAERLVLPRGDAGGETRHTELNIIKVMGAVEHRIKTNPWVAARIGDVLGEQHSLRTRSGSSAILSVGARSQLSISPHTEVSVQEINEKIHTFRLDRGRLAVDYKKDGRRLIRIENDAGAMAEAKEGKFSVLRTRTSMAVATETGTVDLQAAGQQVQLKSGEQSVILDEHPPSVPMAIPKSVLLKIAGLSEKPIEIRGSSTLLRGSTQAGNRVTIQEKPVQVDSQGQFSSRVALKPGLNRVYLAIEDPLGRLRSRIIEYYALPPDGRIEGIKLRWTKER